MLKLYKISGEEKLYWETWQSDDGSFVTHWGELGSEGEVANVSSTGPRAAEDVIREEIDRRIAEGFRPAGEDRQNTLVVEYPVEGHGSERDAERLERLEGIMNQTLGWTGLGHCDGNSIGSGTMEVFNLVVDYPLAKRAIEAALRGTEFESYSRIYDASAG